MKISDLIENDLVFDEKKYFTAIIGGNPSEGARSPILWNYTFKKNKINCNMLSFDVADKNLEKLIFLLNKNKFFLGGAIAVPYKEKIFKLLKNNTSIETSKIGAVNCLYRNNSGELTATNTDGEASLEAFNNTYKSILNRKTLILGMGGAGKAVAAFFAKDINNKKNIYISSRSIEAKSYAELLESNWLNWNIFNDEINKFDIIINCTILGSNKSRHKMPINLNSIKYIKKSAIIYDIIYDPSPTLLLQTASKNNLKILDGKKMNLLQAALAFDYCIKKEDRKFDTFETMFELFSNLS
ncbi:MAG: hypothetical protein CMI96_04200 [Pelagibacteraceae bacterium]|nr:hypothetical protein [Pelagibacteraceae bacterium]